MSRFAMTMGVLMTVWMTLGRWAFGLGGELTWWYLPTIGLGYLAVSYWLARRLTVTRSRGRRTGRATVVTQILSWVCAIGFGFTVPDMTGGQLQSILSHAAGSAFSTEMSIALCNPLGIISFGLLGAAIAFAYADARDPRPEIEEYPGEGEMMQHPLS